MHGNISGICSLHTGCKIVDHLGAIVLSSTRGSVIAAALAGVAVLSGCQQFHSPETAATLGDKRVTLAQVQEVRADWKLLPKQFAENFSETDVAMQLALYEETMRDAQAAGVKSSPVDAEKAMRDVLVQGGVKDAATRPISVQTIRFLQSTSVLRQLGQIPPEINQVKLNPRFGQLSFETRGVKLITVPGWLKDSSANNSLPQ